MVGGSTVKAALLAADAQGAPVNPGKTLPLPVPGGDLTNIFIDAAENDDGVIYMALK
jgi:hypothetical protein